MLQTVAEAPQPSTSQESPNDSPQAAAGIGEHLDTQLTDEDDPQPGQKKRKTGIEGEKAVVTQPPKKTFPRRIGTFSYL